MSEQPVSDGPQLLGKGAVTIKDDQNPVYAAILWVPDPEARYGWREYYIQQNPDCTRQKPGRFGFR